MSAGSGRRFALLFPGQGTLRPNLGAELRVAFPALTGALQRSSELVDLDLIEASGGPLRAMTDTAVAQRLVVAWGLALHEVVIGPALNVVAVAGHSVGELAAAASAGCISGDQALALVSRRADAMADLGDTGTMSAVDGLDRTELERLLGREAPSVSVGLQNGERSCVISGPAASLETAELAARSAGASRVRRLEVGGAFHSPAMHPAAPAWNEALEDFQFSDPEIPVIRNIDGRAVTVGDDVQDGLHLGLEHPVEWQRCVERLACFEPTDLVEVGATGSLIHGVRRAIPDAQCWALWRPREARELVELAGAMGVLT